MKHNITIPGKHYVGMQKRGNSGIPLGFMTPWGEDNAAKSRMATVDRWSGRNALPAVIIDNIPMLGFKMTKNIRTSDHGAADKWRIEDPRGFELEITSMNLAELMGITTIEKGEILDRCVWARNGGNNILLSTESELYKDAVVMTKIATATTSWKDVKIGNSIVLQNGNKGRYLGRMHVICEGGGDSPREVANILIEGNGLMHVIFSEDTKRTYPAGLTSELHFISSPKLSGITDIGNELTVAESELLVNQYIGDNSCYVTNPSYKNILLAAANPIKHDKWRLVLNETEMPVDVFKWRYHDDAVLVRLKDGRLGVPDGHGTDSRVAIINEDLIADGIYSYKTLLTPTRNWGSDRSWQRLTEIVDLSDIVKAYHLRIEFDTKAGNTVYNNI